MSTAPESQHPWHKQGGMGEMARVSLEQVLPWLALDLGCDKAGASDAIAVA